MMRNFVCLLSFAGCNGHWSGIVPALLLFQVIRSARHGDDRHELRLFGIENRRGPQTHPGRHQRVCPHQAGARPTHHPAHDPGRRLYCTKDADYQSRTSGSEGTGLLCARQTSA